MLVGDIYGGRDYNAIGLSATTIASSFGKVISQVGRSPQGGRRLLRGRAGGAVRVACGEGAPTADGCLQFGGRGCQRGPPPLPFSFGKAISRVGHRGEEGL
jgi:hypothetical protein